MEVKINIDKSILMELKEQHPNYDPNWEGTCTFSEDFVLKAIEYARETERKRIKLIKISADSQTSPAKILEAYNYHPPFCECKSANGISKGDGYIACLDCGKCIYLDKK